MIAEYQYARFEGFLHLEQYKSTSGYFYIQLEKAIENARWFGAKELVYLPDIHTNLVLATLIQTYGYLLGLIIICVLIALVVRICQISISIKVSFGKSLIISGEKHYLLLSFYIV